MVKHASTGGDGAASSLVQTGWWLPEDGGSPTGQPVFSWKPPQVTSNVPQVAHRAEDHEMALRQIVSCCSAHRFVAGVRPSWCHWPSREEPTTVRDAMVALSQGLPPSRRATIAD